MVSLPAGLLDAGPFPPGPPPAATTGPTDGRRPGPAADVRGACGRRGPVLGCGRMDQALRRLRGVSMLAGGRPDGPASGRFLPPARPGRRVPHGRRPDRGRCRRAVAGRLGRLAFLRRSHDLLEPRILRGPQGLGLSGPRDPPVGIYVSSVGRRRRRRPARRRGHAHSGGIGPRPRAGDGSAPARPPGRLHRRLAAPGPFHPVPPRLRPRPRGLPGAGPGGRGLRPGTAAGLSKGRGGVFLSLGPGGPSGRQRRAPALLAGVRQRGKHRRHARRPGAPTARRPANQLGRPGAGRRLPPPAAGGGRGAGLLPRHDAVVVPSSRHRPGHALLPDYCAHVRLPFAPGGDPRRVRQPPSPLCRHGLAGHRRQPG